MRRSLSHISSLTYNLGIFLYLSITSVTSDFMNEMKPISLKEKKDIYLTGILKGV